MATEEYIKGYRHPGDIEIQTFKLISTRGQVIDIGSIVVEFNIYQDMFRSFQECSIVINDSLGLINSLGKGNQDPFGGFTGGEMLVISYRSKDENLKFKNHVFLLHKLSDRIRTDEKNESYLISGISVEAYLSSPKSISRAYGIGEGNEIHKMVKSLVEEFMYNKDAEGLYRNYSEITNYKIEKINTYDKTNGYHKFVIPNLTPEETLRFFCSQADNDSHIPYFVFYENSSGFNFRDLNELVKQKEKNRYVYLPSNYNEGRKSSTEEYTDSTKITSYSVKKQSNILSNMLNGLYKSKTINIDLLQKKKTETIFDYTKRSEKFSKLQENFVIPGSVAGGDALRFMMTSRTGHNDSGSPFRAEKHLPKKQNQFIGAKKSYERHIFNTVLEVEIPGDSELTVGDTVYIDIPVASNLKSVDGNSDKYISGKYIITKLRQKMKGKTGEDFLTVFECAKDSRIQ